MGADLTDTLGWEHADLTGANVHGIVNPPPAFVKAAANITYDLDLVTWLNTLKQQGITYPEDRFTYCKYVR